MTTKLITTSMILSILFFSGCTEDDSMTKQPHDTSKFAHAVAIEKDWTWDVSLSVNIAGTNDIEHETFLRTNFWSGVPDNIEIFQIFIDMDNDESTGYSGSDGWQVKGADYVIENGDVYESLSITEWKWNYIGTFQNINYQRSKGEGVYEIFYIGNPTPTLKGIFTSDNFKVMIEAYDANWQGDSNTITGIVADVTRVDTGDDDTNTTGSINEKKVLVSKSVDKDNDGVMDYVTKYTYYSNGKLKTKSSDGFTRYYNDHGDLVRYSSEAFDRYRYFYNNDNKIEKKETLNADGTVKSYEKYKYNSEGKVTNKEILKADGTMIYERYEFNSHGDAIVAYRNGMDEPIWKKKYEYDSKGNILKKECDGDFCESIETFKYDDQNRVIEYFSDTYDSNPIHYRSIYNSEGKEIKRLDLSSDDDGVFYDHYYEYDNKGYLIVEKIDSYENYYENGTIRIKKRGDIDRVIYYEWK